LAAKWEKSGLLEGLDGHESEKANMAVLLENQARQLVNEANATGTGTSITAAGSEAWAGVALPLVRRVFGEIVAKDLVSVQPMNLPSGLIFYLDFQYGTNQPGSGQNQFTSGQSLYSATTDMKKTNLPAAGEAGNGLYGAGRFGYSINETSSAALTLNTDGTLASGEYITGSVAAADYGYNTAFSASHAGQFDNGAVAGVRKITVQTGDLENYDPEGVRAFTLDVSSDSALKAVFNEFTQLSADGSELSFLVSCSNATGLGTLQVVYQKGPDNLNDRGDFEDPFSDANGLGTIEIPEINVQLRSETVTAKTRKLKAQWTPEFAQDLNAYHSIDAEAELTSILSEYISMEIDLEILDMLIRNADTTNHWSAAVGTELLDNGNTTTANSSQYYTKMSWFQTLGVKLQAVSNIIHQKTLRGGANFLVVSPKVSTILESIPGFAADSPGDQNKYAMGVQKIGAVNSRYTVYKNPYMTENTILMGYKGNQFLETGAVFAPYIPLIMTPLVYDPVSFTPRKGIMTRYAKKMVRPDFYGKIFIHDLNLV
jgi:hypothetical protein